MTAPTRPALTREQWERLAQDCAAILAICKRGKLAEDERIPVRMPQSEIRAYELACRTMAALADAGTVERVAKRQIELNQEGVRPDCRWTWAMMDDVQRESARADARAVLAAIRALALPPDATTTNTEGTTDGE